MAPLLNIGPPLAPGKMLGTTAPIQGIKTGQTLTNGLLGGLGQSASAGLRAATPIINQTSGTLPKQFQAKNQPTTGLGSTQMTNDLTSKTNALLNSGNSSTLSGGSVANQNPVPVTGRDAQGNILPGFAGYNSPTSAPIGSNNTPVNANNYSVNNGLYGQLITGLANTPQNNPGVQNATANLQSLQNQLAQQTANIEGRPEDLSLAEGQQGILQRLGAAQIGAAQTALSNALQGQQLQQSALGTAAGLAQPQSYGITSTPYNPVTEQYGSMPGGTSGGLQNTINNVVQMLQNGTMTYQDAQSAVSGYGVAGSNALIAALPPGFNINASQASAGTTATGQQLQTAATAANQALDTLSSSFNALPGIQTGGIPLTNSIANTIASALGEQGLTAYKTALDDARSQLVGALNASGGTPTGNEATAKQYLPDDMTVGQFNTNVGTAQNPGVVRQLLQQKVSSFTTSGKQNQTQTGSNLYSF